jgi:hypothetical protein
MAGDGAHRKSNRPLIFLQHYFSGLDDHGDFVAFLKAKLFCAAAGDHAFDLALPDAHDDMSHDVTEGDFHYFSFQLVSS